MASTAPSSLLRHSWSAVLICLLIGCGLALVFPFLRSVHWAFALFENFALQLTIALLGVLGVALVSKRRRIAIAAAVLLLPVLFQLSYYLWPRPLADEPAQLRVVSFNVLTQNRNHAEVLSFLQSTDADVIALVEISEEWLESLSPLLETHPHTAHFPARHNFGMGLFSRLPIVSHSRPMPTPGHPLIIANLDYEGSLLTVMVGHPVPPMGARSSAYRERYLESCAKAVQERPGPILLMGDFNTTPWSPLFKKLTNSTGLQDSGRGRGYQATWQRNNPLFALPLDHVLYSEEFQPVGRRIGPASGSDHSPLIVDFAFTPTIPVPERKSRRPPLDNHRSRPPIRRPPPETPPSEPSP